MCRADGMVFDDGVVARGSREDRYLVTTTTGNAAAVLDWLEEWLQTEWPELRVLAAPRSPSSGRRSPSSGRESRDVLAPLAPDLAVDREAFRFMASRRARSRGRRACVARICFSGELAYEVNVAGWHGLALWEALCAAGEPHGITPYGTETMHVLRAEKGYVDRRPGHRRHGRRRSTSAWTGSCPSASDFVGRRSLRRPDTTRAGPQAARRPAAGRPGAAAAGGRAARRAGRAGEPPVPMLGHVTSSYRSAALGRTFALALLADGRERHGEVVHATTCATAPRPRWWTPCSTTRRERAVTATDARRSALAHRTPAAWRPRPATTSACAASPPGPDRPARGAGRRGGGARGGRARRRAARRALHRRGAGRAARPLARPRRVARGRPRRHARRRPCRRCARRSATRARRST